MRQTVPHKRQVVLVGKRLANRCASSTMSIATSTALQGDHRQRVETAGRMASATDSSSTAR
jgi:translation initiation factor 1 (eIF-1/SUI1)